jgi:hypothetical protein
MTAGLRDFIKRLAQHSPVVHTDKGIKVKAGFTQRQAFEALPPCIMEMISPVESVSVFKPKWKETQLNFKPRVQICYSIGPIARRLADGNLAVAREFADNTIVAYAEQSRLNRDYAPEVKSLVYHAINNKNITGTKCMKHNGTGTRDRGYMCPYKDGLGMDDSDFHVRQCYYASTGEIPEASGLDFTHFYPVDMTMAKLRASEDPLSW